MKYLLDTCVISDFVKGHPNVLKRLKYEQPNAIAVSSITVMEINYGMKLNPVRAKKIQHIVDRLLAMVNILPYEQEDATTTGSIRSHLKTLGTPIGPYDVMIAGMALSRGLIMVTSNTQEFERIVGLNLEDWQDE